MGFFFFGGGGGFILCFFSFLFFPFAFLVWKFYVLCVALLVVVFSYGHSKPTRSLLLLDLYYSAWRAICDSYHGFYPRPENLFHVTDGRSEGVVPAIEKVGKKKKIKIVFRGGIRTPTDE